MDYKLEDEVRSKEALSLLKKAILLIAKTENKERSDEIAMAFSDELKEQFLSIDPKHDDRHDAEVLQKLKTRRNKQHYITIINPADRQFAS